MPDFLYRITRTQLRGQFANDACFAQWMLGPAASATQTIKAVDDPLNNGGPNDARYYLWVQVSPVATPAKNVCDLSLVTRNGKDGWETQAEAQAVLDAELKASGATAAMVAKANAAATDPVKVLTEAAKDLGKDIGNVANPVSGGIVKFASEALVAVGIAWAGVAYLQSRKR